MSMTRRRLLDDTFKKTIEGNPAIAQGSLARMYPGIVMQGWTEQNGTPTPEAPVPIVSAGTQNQDTGKWEYEITIANAQTDPDKNQTVTLTADRPLTKWDRLEKRNGQWGWVYGSAEIVFDGSEDETWSYIEDGTASRAFTIYDTGGDALCNKYVYDYAMNPGQFDLRGGASEQYIRFNCYGIASDVGSWRTWLSENTLTVLYQTTEETFVPLSQTEQEQMNALHTFRPTTVLSNDADCEMELTYKTKKSLEVTA